jgi:hypothetical protein
LSHCVGLVAWNSFDSSSIPLKLVVKKNDATSPETLAKLEKVGRMIGRASSEQQIKEAVSLLESFGVENIENLCSYDTSVSEILPLCGDAIRRILVPQNFQTVAEKEAFYTTNIVEAVLCVCAVAIIAGLFLGYLTLDVIDLQVRVEIGDYIA